MAARTAAAHEIVPAQEAPVAVVSSVPEDAAKNLRAEAQACYLRMQRDWFEFAQKLQRISETNAFVALGYDTFKAFCAAEYVELNYVQLLKMVQVVQEVGPALEAHVLAQPEEPVPALENLYMVVSAKKKFADDKGALRRLGTLTTKVINGDISFGKLKESLNALREVKTAEPTDGTRASAERLEQELVEDLRRDDDLAALAPAERAATVIQSQIPALAEQVAALMTAVQADPAQVTAKVRDAFRQMNELLVKLDTALEWMEAQDKAR